MQTGMCRACKCQGGHRGRWDWLLKGLARLEGGRILTGLSSEAQHLESLPLAGVVEKWAEPWPRGQRLCQYIMPSLVASVSCPIKWE